MPLALTAKIRVSPESILRDKRLHDIAHDFLAARVLAMKRNQFSFAHMPKLLD